MTAEEIRKLGEAIAQHAELLAELDYAEDEPVAVLEQSTSLGLLKNARLIEAVEDDNYFPGEHYELLRKTIYTSSYEMSAMPDILDWFSHVNHLSSQYAAIEQEALEDDRHQIRKALVRSLFQMGTHLKGLIREVDRKASAEFGYCKTLPAKIREGHYYRERTSEILAKLERLDYVSLSKISSHPDIEYLTLGKLFSKIDGLRADLSLVLVKLQKLSASFKETELRTRQYRRILAALDEKRLDVDTILDRIDWDQIPLLNSVSNESLSPIMAGYDHEKTTSFTQSCFNDIAAKIKLPDLMNHVVVSPEVVYWDREEETSDETPVYDFAQLIQAHQFNFSQQLVTSTTPISVIDYWQQHDALQNQVSANAWLLEMSQWLADAQQSLDSTAMVMAIDMIESEPLQHTDMIEVYDIQARLTIGKML